MQYRKIGTRSVSAIGLGGMPMSLDSRPPREQSITTIHAALDAGITFIDTADVYSRDNDDFGHNELLIAEALRTWGGDLDDVLLATKGGLVRTTVDGPWPHDARPEHLHAAVRASLTRLGVEQIGLYQLHRPDPEVPYADSIGAIAEMLDAGLIAMAGISNASNAQIDEANAVLGGRLVSVQNQFSPAYTSSLVELEHCAELGIAFLPWSPLGGIRGAAALDGAGTAFEAVAAERGVTPQVVALAWELALADVVVPIPGASKPASIENSATAADLELTADEVARLTAG